jgi:hypothetical protein
LFMYRSLWIAPNGVFNLPISEHTSMIGTGKTVWEGIKDPDDHPKAHSAWPAGPSI